MLRNMPKLSVKNDSRRSTNEDLPRFFSPHRRHPFLDVQDPLPFFHNPHPAACDDIPPTLVERYHTSDIELLEWFEVAEIVEGGGGFSGGGEVITIVGEGEGDG